VIVHRGEIKEGTLKTGTEVKAVVPANVRWSTMRNHTATHLLHKALRDTLGKHVHQAGSVVEPGRLRFDFSHNTALTREELLEIERNVNEQIYADLPVEPKEMPYKQAVEMGAMALFGEKYGDVVRMVRIPGYESRELCGGTHVERTGQIGPFYITYEGSIGSGTRRIEAVTGAGAVEWAQERREIVGQVAHKLQTQPNRVVEQAEALREQLKEAQRKIEALQRQIARGEGGGLSQEVREVEGVTVATGKTSVTSVEALREAGDHLRDKLGSGVVVLGADIDGAPRLIAMVTKDLTERGLSAGNIIKAITPAIGGAGGGPPHMAQGGGRDPGGIDAALGMVPGVVEEALKA
jgi:alanyl-tRNA synthetase